MKQSITLPRAPGRIRTFKPTGDGSRYSIEIVLDVTAKDYDKAVGELFAGYVHVVSDAAMSKAAATKIVATKKPANVNLTIDDGSAAQGEVLRKIDAPVKAPKLTVGREGASAEMTIVVEVALTNAELGRVADYRGADAFFTIEPTQLDIEDSADKPAKKKRSARKAIERAPTQLDIVKQTQAEADARLAAEFGIVDEKDSGEAPPSIN